MRQGYIPSNLRRYRAVLHAADSLRAPYALLPRMKFWIEFHLLGPYFAHIFVTMEFPGPFLLESLVGFFEPGLIFKFLNRCLNIAEEITEMGGGVE